MAFDRMPPSARIARPDPTAENVGAADAAGQDLMCREIQVVVFQGHEKMSITVGFVPSKMGLFFLGLGAVGGRLAPDGTNQDLLAKPFDPR